MTAPPPFDTRDAPRGVFFSRVCAVVVAVFGFFPIANWIPGGHDADWYSVSLSDWLNGSLIVVGLAVVGVIVTRRLNIWPTGAGERLAAVAHRRSGWTAAVLSGLAFALYAAIARLVFSGKPLLVDEIAQVIQARIFATGHLTAATSTFPEFFSAMHIVNFAGRTFSQFPPGGPLMLLPGVLAGAAWLVGPLFGALAVGVYWSLVRASEPDRAVSLGAVLLFAGAPFMAFMAGSHMNHVPTLFWLCLAMWSLERLVRADRAAPWMSFLLGTSFGIAATIRPTDAASFAVPAGIWLVARAVRSRRCIIDVVAAGVGLAIPLALLLAFNAHTTGRPLLFGYELLWGKSHGLGFHQAPWGVTHTPMRGLELVNLYFLRLQQYLFETPVPSLVPCVLALALTRRVTGFDRYLLWSAAVLVLSYFAYWHDGFYLGPRFVYLLLPALALWTARLPMIIRGRLSGVPGAERFVQLAYGISACMALLFGIPMRERQYAGGLLSERTDYVGIASRSGVRNALILVRESWGSQVITRMWALGVPHSETETLYRGVDTCVLDSAVSRLERSHVEGAPALAALTPLLRDSSRVIKSTASPDETERVLPDHPYSPQCVQRVIEDRSGYTFLAPILAQVPGSNVYARDLHARDTVLLRSYPGRSVYLMRPASSALGAPIQLTPLAVDSARADWGHGAGY